MEGDATVTPDGLLRLTDQKPNTIVTTFYRKAVRLLEPHRNVRSFSTCIVFAINPTSSKEGGYGFTFTLSPTPYGRRADSGQYMGLFSDVTNGNPRNHVFAVEFDTVQGFDDGYHRMGSHIGVNFNSLASEFEGPVLFYKNDRREEFLLQTGEPIKADITYDGFTKLLNVTVYPAEISPSPVRPSISVPVPKLSRIIEEEMYVGFTAATGDGERSSAHDVMGWSFKSGGEHPVAATKLNLSELPHPPTNTAEKSGYSSDKIGLIAFAAISGAALIVAFVIYRKKRGETLEDWEVTHPHRMSYRDLDSATDGFSEERIIGSGGFGTVFRGSLSSSLGEILHSVDERLEACYDTEEAREALLVGLLCCHMRPECRPSIGLVLSYLNSEESVPNINETWGISAFSTTSLAPFSLTKTSSCSAQTG
ncbi:unnamed protein product [Eruca vesicaria subsp. sativa]|uniref:Legume lectin domain-containing protein n=1 Tax=Eruca vesicaria subsp. sativa TaxID=29727 RepID=A0ABC8MA33_ERUVS|nr:unnamed protein product [Eruca vesicaria subsp. sativa]